LRRWALLKGMRPCDQRARNRDEQRDKQHPGAKAPER
jgi:hypothetical protein